MKQLLFVLRVVLVGVFLVFIALYGLCVFPFFPKSKNKVHHMAYFFRVMSSLLGLQVERRFSEASQQVPQAVYISNHQNNADLFTLCHAMPKGAVTVGKKSLFWIPFFGILYWITGNILINRTNSKKARATIEQVVAQMRATGLSILMFPEGTRSRGRGLLPFKTGAFHTAIKAGVPIIPIVCSDTDQQVQLGRFDNGKAIVEMLDPISTENMSDDVREFMDQCRNIMQSKYLELNQELGKANDKTA